MRWAGVARGRWRLLRNTLFPRGRGRAPWSASRPFLGGALALLLAAMVALGLAGLFAVLADAGAGAVEAGAALGLVLSATVLGLLVFDLHAAVSTLIADSDLELLRRAPIPPRSLFLLKLADTVPRTSVLIVILALPAVAAYHAFHPLPRWAWPILPLQLGALWAIPLGVGIALAILLLRRVPARRARETLGLLSTVTILALWLANSFLLPRIADTSGEPLARLQHALSAASRAGWLSPGQWAARALAAEASGSAADAAAATAGLVLAAALSLGVAGWIASRYIETVQSRIVGAGGGKRPVSSGAGRVAAARRAASDPIAAAGPGAARRSLLATVVRRDRRLFVRDWTVLGDVLTAAVLWALLPLVATPLFPASSGGLASAMLVVLAVGLGYEVAARSIPFERFGAAWMRLSPVPASRWVAAKLAGAAALSIPLVGLAATSLAVAMSLPAGAILTALCAAFPALGLSLSVGLWTGAKFGDPGWTNPRAMLTLTGRIVATLLLLAQAGGWLALLSLADLGARALPPGAELWGPAVLGGSLAALSLRAGARLLARREWKG